MVQVINRLQQRKDPDDKFDHVRNSFGGKGVAAGKHNHVPPEVPPAIFSLPKGQEVAPSAGMLPTARGDLEQLTRMSVELFGAAFGVPSDLLFSGRFASKSTAQLSLLNSTVSSLAKSINEVLTEAYIDVYGEEEGDVSLELITAPLAASEEVLALFAGGLCPAEVAVPSVLHAIGASKDQIEDAVDQAVKERQRLRDNEQNVADGEKSSREQDQAAKQQEGKANEARLVIELEQAKANVRKTDAETADIKKPDPAPAAKKAKK